MGLFLSRVKMSRETLKSLMAKPEDRTAPLKSSLEAAGAKLLNIWYSASTGDLIVLSEAPTVQASMSHAAMANAGGVIDACAVEELMTPAQFVEVMKTAASIVAGFRPPGR